MLSAQQIIKNVLSDAEESNINSDGELYETVCAIHLAENHDMCLYDFSAKGFFQLLQDGKLPLPETVRRARQKAGINFKKVITPVIEEEQVVEEEVAPLETIII